MGKHLGARHWLRIAMLLVAVALLCGARCELDAQPGNQTMSPEQSKAIEEVLKLMTQAITLEQQGKVDEAIALRESASELCERVVGAENFVCVLNLPPLASLYKRKGDLPRAETVYLRELSIRAKMQGPEHPDLAKPLDALGIIYLGREDFAQAEATFKRALAIQEKILGAEHPALARTLYFLSATYSRRSDYARAEPLLKRALSIQEKVAGPESFDVAATLNNLASLYQETGNYEQAESLFLRSIAIYEKLYGPDHPEVATPLNSLATLYREKADYLRAELLFKRALAIFEKARGPESEDVGIVLNSLAMLYTAKGDDERALPLFERSLAIREKALGPEHSSVAAALINIALLRSERGEHRQAVELYKRALAILEKTYADETPLHATLLGNLATSYIELGEVAQAEPLLRRALEIRERVLGPEHPSVAFALNGLGYLYFMKKEYAREEELYRRAVGIAEKSLGPDHPTVGGLLANLATAYWWRGDIPQTLSTLMRVSELRERNLALVLTTGSEEQKRRYIGTLTNETDASVSFHVRDAPQERGAADLALTVILRRKGRVLDAMTDQLGALRRRLDPQDRALLDQLSAARSALARLVLGGGAGDEDRAAHRAEKERLQAEVERLEEEVGARSAEFRTQAQTVTLKAVQDAIPAGAALVEIVLYRPYDVKAEERKTRFGAPRYVAYVLRGGSDPLWVELGEAEKIDQEVKAWRLSLADPRTREVKERARSLDELIMQPVRQLLGDTRQLFLSPDGALNLIPFGALVNREGHYLIESFSVTYLTSGRDLLRLQASVENRQQQPIVIANPLFDGTTVDRQARDSEPAAPGRRSADLTRARFSPLPGTKGEAAALGSILTGVKVFTGAQATEAMLKHISRPSILHIATHGFFLPDQEQSASGMAQRELAARGMGLSVVSREPQNVPGENPLLRSGLALAGANRQKDGAGEDGVLTALEAAGLNLWGTKLVVLSACETGVGEVKNGDGVYGLRRALVLAGSESQVMSLWQVSDEATRDLMVGYYRRLQAGEGRTEALRAVQLEMLRSGRQQIPTRHEKDLSLKRESAGKQNRSHPFFWASFIQSGEWRSMSGRGAETRQE